MSSETKFLNYITTTLAVVTIIVTIATKIYNINKIYSIICLILTIMFYFLNRSFIDKEMNLSREDKELLEKLREKKKG